MAQLPPELTAVTTRLDTSFLRPARLGKLNATALIVSRDERTAEVAAEIADAAGQVLAKALSTWRIVKRNR
jgi:acyl-coenzyme A thioesterase PaaI-like protein